MTYNLKDVLAGLIFIGIAAAFAGEALNLDLGTASRMGPGYFPLMLSGVLALFGLIIIIRAFGNVGTAIGRVPVRGFVLILAAPVVFGLTLRGLGFIPSVGLVALMAAMASRRTTALAAIGSVVILTAFSVAVFLYGLNVPLALFGPWLEPVTAAFAGA